MSLAPSAFELEPDGARRFALTPASLAQVAELGLDDGQTFADHYDQPLGRVLTTVEGEAAVLRLGALLGVLGQPGFDLVEAPAQYLPALFDARRTDLDIGANRADRVGPGLDVAAAGRHGAPALEQLGLFGFVLRKQCFELAHS